MINALVRRSLRNERVMVHEPARVRRLLVFDLVSFAALLVLVIARPWLPTAVQAVLWFVVCGLAGAVVALRTRRALAYRNGWLDGRSEMVNALEEAVRRDMSPGDWLRAEAVRDSAVLGVKLPDFDFDDD